MRNLLDVVNCPHLPLSDMLDLLAFDLIEHPAGRLEFLDQPDVTPRAAWLGDLPAQIQQRTPRPKEPARERSRFQSDH